ncbi:prepilin peptidase [Lactobacillaceae bacterium Melli_B4]
MQLIFLFIIGSVIGSFVSLSLQRIERSESIIIPRSHCDHCQTKLKIIDLVPILSYLMLSGKCRYCSHQINKLTIINECLWGGLFLMQGIYKFPLLLFSSLLILIVLSFIDIDKLMVPTTLIIVNLLNNLIYYFWFNSGSIIPLLAAMLIYPLVLKANQRWLHIGEGDIDIIFIMWLAVGFHNLLGLIIVASIMALLYLLFNQKRPKVAFIPFLTISYLICILIYM